MMEVYMVILSQWFARGMLYTGLCIWFDPQKMYQEEDEDEDEKVLKSRREAWEEV